MSVPLYVVERIRAYSNASSIVPLSTPVVCFGDVTQARVLTVGINPSSSEFTATKRGKRNPLLHKDRRLADLKHLEAKSNTELNEDQVNEVWTDCLNYFEKNPYLWFDRLESTVNLPLGASYWDRSACHLDLVQWATDPLWQKLSKTAPDEAKALLESDFPFLEQQLDESPCDYIFLSGATVIKHLSDKFSLKLIGKTKAEGKKGQNTLYLSNWKGKQIFATTMNVSDSHTSNEHRSFLFDWIKDQVRNG